MPDGVSLSNSGTAFLVKLVLSWKGFNSAALSSTLGFSVSDSDEATGMLLSPICWDLDLLSNGGFLGTGGAGFRDMIEEEVVDIWLEVRDLGPWASICATFTSWPALDVNPCIALNEVREECRSSLTLGSSDVKAEVWLVELSIQSDSAVGVKGFEGLPGLRIDLSLGALISDRAGSPNATNQLAIM